jgi:hypothetical protein
MIHSTFSCRKPKARRPGTPAQHGRIARLEGQKSRLLNLTELYSFGKVPVSPFFHLEGACERKNNVLRSGNADAGFPQ